MLFIWNCFLFGRVGKLDVLKFLARKLLKHPKDFMHTIAQGVTFPDYPKALYRGRSCGCKDGHFNLLVTLQVQSLRTDHCTTEWYLYNVYFLLKNAVIV